MLLQLRLQTPTRAVPLARPLGVNHLQQHQVLVATVLYVCMSIPFAPSSGLGHTGCALSRHPLRSWRSLCAAFVYCASNSIFLPCPCDHALRQTTRSARSRVEATGALYRYLILLTLNTTYNHVKSTSLCGLWTVE